MNGKTDKEILEERENIFQLVKEKYPDAELIDSYFEDYIPATGNVGLKYLSKSLELLADAGVAYFAKGWEEARGCRIEHQCAVDYLIDIVEV